MKFNPTVSNSFLLNYLYLFENTIKMFQKGFKLKVFLENNDFRFLQGP